MLNNRMKVALVCDWLTNVGGAEKVLLKIHKMYPKAPIYTSKYDPKGIDWFQNADVRTGWLQVFPTRLRRVLGPFRQWYFSRLDLSEYDLIISVTGAEAKAVKSGRFLHEKKKKKNVKNPEGFHVCFCHVPTQYYWQMYDTYVENPGFGLLNPIVRVFFKLFVRPLRRADYRAAQRPDCYITISQYAEEAIREYYGREAQVIHPPVEVEDFQLKNLAKGGVGNGSKGEVKSSPEAGSKGWDKGVESGQKDYSDYYITTSRQVNWKRIDLAISACLMSQRKLLVVGEGPEHKKLVKMAEGTKLVEFLPLVGKDELAKLLSDAKGYLFPSLEPFGIAPVEALAAGCPVIAFGEGGACDYVRDGENGLLFTEQTVESLAKAILDFEEMKFDRKKVSQSVKDYGEKRFEKEIREFIDEAIK